MESLSFMTHLYAVLEYKDRKGRWPEYIMVNPACMHHVAFELDLILEQYPEFDDWPMGILPKKKLPFGTCQCGNHREITQIIEMMDALPNVAVELPDGGFHYPALN